MLNVAAIVGRLSADPELRHTASGVAVTSFTLAVDRSYAKAGTERQTDLSLIHIFSLATSIFMATSRFWNWLRST